MIDPAMVRPGRLDKLLYVDLPSADERAEIMRTVTRDIPLRRSNSDIGEQGLESEVRREVEEMARERCEGYSGADLAAIVREAGVVALKRVLGNLGDVDDVGGSHCTRDGPAPQMVVLVEDFCRALDRVGPSVSAAQRRKYEAMRSKFAGLPVRMGRNEGDELAKNWVK
jgi:ribosome biogenesis ATPase